MSKLPTITVEVQDLTKRRPTAKITPDKEGISKAVGRLKPYKSLPYTFRPILEKIAEYVRFEMIPETFEHEGPGWAPLARRTVSERLQLGLPGRHPILIRTRDLFKELTQRSHPKHVEVIKTGKHARVEIGGSSVKFLENQLGKKEQNLPARPMIPGTGTIPFRDRDRKRLGQIIEKGIKDRVRKAQ